jgi:hypothetical protein
MSSARCCRGESARAWGGVARSTFTWKVVSRTPHSDRAGAAPVRAVRQRRGPLSTWRSQQLVLTPPRLIRILPDLRRAPSSSYSGRLSAISFKEHGRETIRMTPRHKTAIGIYAQSDCGPERSFTCQRAARRTRPRVTRFLKSLGGDQSSDPSKSLCARLERGLDQGSLSKIGRHLESRGPSS